MTTNTYISPGYIIVQWPWIGMIYKMWHAWSLPCTIYNRSESPWWRYQMDQDLHRSWIYTMYQDLHNGWRYLTYTGIKSRELNLMNTGMIKEVANAECLQAGKYSTQTTTSTCPTMRTKVSLERILGKKWAS